MQTRRNNHELKFLAVYYGADSLAPPWARYSEFLSWTVPVLNPALFYTYGADGAHYLTIFVYP